MPSLAAHPLPGLLRAGVRCTLNADDPLLFGVGLAEEFALARDELGLSDDELATLARTSVAASGAPDDLRRTADAAITRWLATDPAAAALG